MRLTALAFLLAANLSTGVSAAGGKASRTRSAPVDPAVRADYARASRITPELVALYEAALARSTPAPDFSPAAQEKHVAYALLAALMLAVVWPLFDRRRRLL